VRKIPKLPREGLKNRASPVRLEWDRTVVRKKFIAARVRMLAWPALTAASAAAAFCCWQLPAADVGLEIRNAAADQVRITWRRDSAPALLARSGALDIYDGASVRRLLLTGEQLRDGSLTYRRQTQYVRVRLRVDTGSQWARLNDISESAAFRAAEPPVEKAAVAPIPPAPIASAVVKTAPPAPRKTAAESANRAIAERRAAVIPQGLPSGSADDDPPMPPAPSMAVPRPVVGPLAMVMAGPGATPPRLPVYTGPRSGRMIWTGSMGRRGVVEIEGAHASIGSLSGGLPGVPVSVRISPADFSARGLIVHTGDVAYNERREIASAANGWNATIYRWEPDRARELVVLEAPNPSNDFKRLVVRNDARSCRVMLVEWSVN
jgi:hypothetical protein